MQRRRALLSSLLFAVLVPGNVVVVIPWLISRWQMQTPFFDLPALRWLGVAMILVGAPVLLEAIARFAWQGRGTPAPILPTEQLVVTGTYRYVRNPMYVAVLSSLFGQALLFGSANLLIYAACVGVGFHAFVRFYEEPTLRRQFDGSYEVYCRSVRRWWPRLTPWSPI